MVPVPRVLLVHEELTPMVDPDSLDPVVLADSVVVFSQLLSEYFP